MSVYKLIESTHPMLKLPIEKCSDEIDKHKHRQDTAGYDARMMNRILDSLRRKGSLYEGVNLGRGKGKVFAAQYDPRYMPAGMDIEDSDNKININR